MRLLLDTNVWLDFFLDRSVRHDTAGALVAESNRRGVELCTAAQAVRDVYYQVGQELKRMERDANGSVSESSARAINEIAWACVACVRKQSVIVGSDASDVVEAMSMRSNHPDFEDNSLAAAVARSRSDYLVTSDKQLLKHQIVPSLSIDEAIALLGNLASDE